MPTLASTGKLIPKSIIRHRPIGENMPFPIKAAPRSSTRTRVNYVRPITAQIPTTEQVVEWKRATKELAKSPSSQPQPVKTKQSKTTRAVSGTSTFPAQKKRQATAQSEAHQAVSYQGSHPLLYLGSGMLLTILLWFVLSSVCAWLNTTYNDLLYGRPRTFQTDAWVGHNEQNGSPSHFIALNLNRHIQVIEISGGDAAHTHIYTGPQLYGTTDDLIPITLAFRDVNGDHKPDMIILFQGNHTVFLNDQGTFRAPKGDEREKIEQFLHQHPV
ncbi:hypothetical protein [Tengunoibacter tsumagoiensis]|uniref:VCBS repeat-containing protein n=1 Tax=Tengunoibacter tsumagoiensis TaxID=2014871 RepID=A0A402A1J3_9CHLR|nr:hypothetical protein [Tengunoibacter tsumagoiensis]GCE12926.1 hypothetical protein KTT_27850 [Tengunoibacter tsumagoiensis]